MGFRVHLLCWNCAEMFGNLSIFVVIWKNCTKNYRENCTKNYREGKGNREMGEGSRGKGAGSREQGAGSRELGAGRESVLH